jgi:Domain of unknown function (DUF6986)
MARRPLALLPVGPYREPRSDQERAANREAVFRAWARAADDIRRAYRDGIVQGWDLHPAQLPARYGALFATLREEIAPAAARLRKFLDQAAQATRLGAEFDDAATARGLLNGLRRAVEMQRSGFQKVATRALEVAGMGYAVGRAPPEP